MEIKDILSIIVMFCNICIMAYGFYKFLGRPHSTLEAKVIALEKEVQDLKLDVRDGDKQIAVNANALGVIQKCLLALLEFEISFCLSSGYNDTDDLEAAKRELHNYLSTK